AGAPRSGQGEEQPFQLLLGHRWLVTLLPRLLAVPHAAGDDLEPRTIKSTGNGGQLGEHLSAVPTFHDGLDHTAQLTLRPAQPGQRVTDHLRFHLHGNHLLSPGPNVTYPGGYSARARRNGELEV